MPRAILDENVSLQVAARLEATRDAHFTNPVRFPSVETGGILFITHGNLRGHDEAELIEQFLKEHRTEDFAGHLVFLSPAGARIR